MKKKSIIYVCVAYWGSYDEHDTTIIYAGIDKKEAQKIFKEYIFPTEDNNWGYIETWENGKKIKKELVRE